MLLDEPVSAVAVARPGTRLTVFPNPGAGRFRFQVDGEDPVAMTRVEIYDLRGRRIRTISSDSPAVLSRAADRQLTDIDVIVNARVAMDPDELARQVESTVRTVCRELSAEPTFLQTQSFRPGRPNPTYRYADAL